MAILSFRFVSVAFSACFLRIKVKRALLSLFLEVLGGGNRGANSKKVDSKVVNSKAAYSKDIGSGKAASEKVYEFSADSALYIF